MPVNKENKIDTVGFQLRQITTDQFAILAELYDSSIEKIGLSINLKFGLDKEKHIIASSVLVKFEQKKKPFIITEVTNHFDIEEKAWDSFFDSEDKAIIPKGFASHLVVLTIGTLRGVLHAKTENTEFNKFVLPTINVMNMVKDDVELSD